MSTTATRIYTITQAADELGLTRQRVHQVADRLGVGVMQGSHKLLTEEDVQAIRNRPDWRALWRAERREADRYGSE